MLKKPKGLSRPLPRPKSNRQVKGHHLQEEGKEEKREYPSSITRNTDKWYEVRSFYDAVNTNFDNSFIAGRKLVADEIMCSWHGLSVSYDTEGVPHVTQIARKPEGIGIELKALACGESGVILKLEVVEG